MQQLFRVFFLTVFLIAGFLIANAHAQIAISGSVTDANTGESLIGVTIMIEGTQQGTITDINGRFTLNVPTRNAVIVCSYIGYSSVRIEVGDTRQFAIDLSPEVSELGEVVVTAQARGQRRAMYEQVQSNTLKNVVAPDRLQENPDANAVEAIGRLPGISVLRSGGEGHALVVRGLEPRYTNVTLGGVQMSGTGGSGETNISGISQYILQGVEVYKALTPDMEANAVGGSINLRLRETPRGLNYHLMAQGGYNNLNNYFGNYKLQGEISNRFLDDKLGVFASVISERVNRGTQTMSANFGLAATEVDILLNSVNLNQISTTKVRHNAMASLDYNLSASTTLFLYSMYSYSQDKHNRQSKNYGTTGIGSIGYGFHDNPYRNTDIWHSALTGETKLGFLELDYGMAYSVSTMNDPDSRDWNLSYRRMPVNASFTNEVRRKHPTEVLRLYDEASDSLHLLTLTGFGIFSGETMDNNLSGYLNAKVPYAIGNFITGYFKLGGTYRDRGRFQDFNSGGQNFAANQFGTILLSDSISWLQRTNNFIMAEGMQDHMIDNFLDGQFNYGWYFNFDRLNEITDFWSRISEHYYNQGSAVWMPMFGEKSKIGYSQNISGSMMNDQDISEQYGAGYLMTEINLGKYAMLLPGVRYERTNASMKGFKAYQPTLPDPIYAPLPGDSTEATRGDEFWLPMVHLRLKPVSWSYLHFAYTNTISRPGFNDISPNIYMNTGFSPFTYVATNPQLKAEQWENYDLQLTFHGNKVGLVSISGFHKTVRDKMWHRNYQRLRGDPIIEPFPDASLVNVNVWENHQYPIYLTGVELEVQTSFWYLPKPFNYFTIYANYTYTKSETQYPLSYLVSAVPPGGGRPVTTRIDTTSIGPMLFQPTHISNISLGFNRNDLNIWLSFQYKGDIFTGKNVRVEELDPLKAHFYQWDLQITHKIPGILKGMEVMANIANLSNFTEMSRLRGDPRPTYIESYGWTMDLGVRYRFTK